jgi:SAM-dependent methyltransferase
VAALQPSPRNKIVARIAPFDKYAEEYEEWFEKNYFAYLSELEAVKEQLPTGGRGMEVGVGSGRFAAPLGITTGVEPSRRMRRIAKQRGIAVAAGIGEALPFAAAEFDLVLMVTTICFLDDVTAAFAEAYRVLRNGGSFVVGFIDRDSPLGRLYERRRERSRFYRVASFFSATEVARYLERAGFQEVSFTQTIFRALSEITRVEPVKPGRGDGSFLVARGRK